MNTSKFVFLFSLSMMSSYAANTFANFQQTDELLRNETNQCETLIIFDLSKNVIKNDIFDISVKYFLNLIVEYCNGFKYVIVDPNLTDNCGGSEGCKIVMNDCNSNECVKIIEGMDYNNFTSSYPNILLDSDAGHSLHYYHYLNNIFSNISDSPAILLTNRIVLYDDNSGLKDTLDDSRITFTVIILGQIKTNATTFLGTQFRTLNLENCDCLSYLFYCILPCLEVIPECMKVDIDDCQMIPTTPNENPKQTLHLWVIYAFNDLFTDFPVIYPNIVDAIMIYATHNNVNLARIRVMNGNKNISLSFDINQLQNLNDTVLVPMKGNIMDDLNYLNDQLSMIPWSGTLTESRIGVLAVLILTNYATSNLKTNILGQELQGIMHIYNSQAYSYYSSSLKNSTNFHYSFLNFADPFSIYPIKTAYNKQTTSNPSTPTTSFVVSKNLTTSPILTTTLNTGIIITTTTTTTTTSEARVEGIKHSHNSSIIGIVSGIFCLLLIIIVVGVIIYRRIRKRQRAVTTTEGRQANEVNQKKSITYPDEWELTWDKLIIKNEIGAGAFGDIRFGIMRKFDNNLNDESIEVAIKMPSKLATNAAKTKKISGQSNIIRMHGCITIGDRICLVLAFCQHSDILYYVKEVSTNIDEENIHGLPIDFLKFFWQISVGLEFLATKRIVHRDLAARNILINSGKNAKITDFGLSIQLRDRTFIIMSHDREKLPIKWLAIESLKSYRFSLKTDIWTFAILLFEVYSIGEPPYANIETGELLNYIETGHRLPKPDLCPQEIYEIMLKCWKVNPVRRPSASDLINNFTILLQSDPDATM